jgi:SAM-dependent methyltransferase
MEVDAHAAADRVIKEKQTMFRGFPTSAIDLLCCPRDGGALYGEFDAEFVSKGAASCRRCASSYCIEEGILRLLDPDALDQVSRENRVVFEHNFATESFDQELREESLAEIKPTMDALEPLVGCRVLEYGCGNGRYTVRMAPGTSLTVAVDFSIAALRKVSSRVESTWNIALVQADVLRPVAQSGKFDRALCTLTSNLPSKDDRCRLFQAAARALKPDGWFVHGVHHFNLRARLQRVPRHGYYEGHRIYRYLSGRSEIAEETRTAFERVECRPMVVWLPFTRRFGLATAAASFRLEKIPLLNNFSELLLVTARKPRAIAHAHNCSLE